MTNSDQSNQSNGGAQSNAIDFDSSYNNTIDSPDGKSINESSTVTTPRTKAAIPVRLNNTPTAGGPNHIVKKKTNIAPNIMNNNSNKESNNNNTATTTTAVATRRSKACEYCRSLKVRCIPVDPDQPSDPCVRCVKTRRQCVFHVGPRKRTRKTDK